MAKLPSDRGSMPEAGDAMSRPVLRRMTAGDLDSVAALDSALFNPEAWSRRMLAGELAQQPAARDADAAGDDHRDDDAAGDEPPRRRRCR